MAKMKNPDKLGGSLDGPSPKTPAPKAPVKAKQAERKDAVNKLIQDVTNRYRVTAREARDIVTAVSTATTSASSGFQEKASLKNVARQVGETVKAAKTGQKGTTSDIARKDKVTPVTSATTGKSMGTIKSSSYTKGQGRK
jgi:hypothetical protein